MSEHSPWPRLLAHWDGRGLNTAQLHSDGRRSHAALRSVADAAQLPAALRTEARGLCHVALVMDVPARLGDVEVLRRRLDLQTLLALEPGHALALALPEADPALLHWLVPASTTPPTLLCRWGEPDQEARLFTADGQPPAALNALLQHPLSPLDEDEALLVDQAREEGRLWRLGQLLGPQGLMRAYQALARAEQRAESPWLTAEHLLALAPHDALARRACSLVCGALATLCALLALAGERSVLLCGAWEEMRGVLRDYAWEPRLKRLLGGRAPQPAIACWAEQAPQLTLCFDGAARALASHWREQSERRGDGISELVRASYERLSRSERRVADLVLADASAVLRSPTAELARHASVSQPQVIRFCRSLGFEGVKDFRRELGTSLALNARTDCLAPERREIPQAENHGR
ncbi:MAG TPA: hypothetical protein VGM81_04650 [Burkholderiaceae bacterium]|jgi:glucokinase